MVVDIGEWIGSTERANDGEGEQLLQHLDEVMMLELTNYHNLFKCPLKSLLSLLKFCYQTYTNNEFNDGIQETLKKNLGGIILFLISRVSPT